MRRTGLILGVIGSILVAAVWWLLLMSPERSKVSEAEGQRDELVIEETQLRSEKAQLLAIRDNELTYMTAGAALERLIPPTPELATFIEDVNVLADDTGVVLNSLTPGLPAQEAFAEFQSVAVFIDLEGQFFEVLGFLYGLSDMERLVRVDSVTLTAATSDTGLTTLSASVDSLIFTTAGAIPAAAEVPAEGDAPADEGAGS